MIISKSLCLYFWSCAAPVIDLFQIEFTLVKDFSIFKKHSARRVITDALLVTLELFEQNTYHPQLTRGEVCIRACWLALK